MDIAWMIVESAKLLEQKERDEHITRIEIIHNIFDEYACAQVVTLRVDERNSNIIIRYKFTDLTFTSIKEFINNGAADILLGTILHDFLQFIQSNEFTDMDFVTMNVFSGKQRVAIQHMYFRDMLCDPSDHLQWSSDKQAIAISSSFRKIVMLAGACLKKKSCI